MARWGMGGQFVFVLFFLGVSGFSGGPILLQESYLTFYVQTEGSLMFLGYFTLFKVILIVFYFLNNLFMRKCVSKLTQASIKIFKIS